MSILPPSAPSASSAAAVWPVKRSSNSLTRPESPPRFIEPKISLPSSAPEQEQVIHDVRGGQDAVDVRVGEGDLQAVQELAAVRHGHRVVADREGAAGRVVGGDDEVLPAVT